MACKGSGVQILLAPPQVRRSLRRRPRQGHRLAEPAVRPVAPQRRLARTGPGRLRPDLLGAGAAAGRYARPRRTQDAPPPAVAYRRPGGPPRPPPILRLQRTWPWSAALARAFVRLRALHLRC